MESGTHVKSVEITLNTFAVQTKCLELSVLLMLHYDDYNHFEYTILEDNFSDRVA